MYCSDKTVHTSFSGCDKHNILIVNPRGFDKISLRLIMDSLRQNPVGDSR